MRSCFDVELDGVGNVAAEFLTVTLNSKLYQDNRKKRRRPKKAHPNYIFIEFGMIFF
jgi:hypothetical protein